MRRAVGLVSLLYFLLLLSCVGLLMTQDKAPYEYIAEVVKKQGELATCPDGCKVWMLRLKHKYESASKLKARLVEYRVNYGTLTEKRVEQDSFPSATYLEIMRNEIVFAYNGETESAVASWSVDFGPDGKVEMAAAVSPHGTWMRINPKIMERYLHGTRYDEIILFIQNGWFA